MEHPGGLHSQNLAGKERGRLSSSGICHSDLDCNLHSSERWSDPWMSLIIPAIQGSCEQKLGPSVEAEGFFVGLDWIAFCFPACQPTFEEFDP